ncbi:adenosylcobinamide-phosphate synthase [Rhodococcus sp. OK611]|uniref:cobalamin biosynthesis protein n=1 Tax=unclassified Rhodococcus (in: high G+C Gram-positive bacteria) TaxID=192944 RepID=UPI000BD51276|nr:MULTISPECIES: cobalamin biosynthesis protein [unclassified Rhodococcus (in: high G+C Gram-positive bacteria)]PTR41979.1 adenosylcobinamide-phosphate synthase [Rhodococcus sp. OK611]SNX91574.1 adenosylcobinamide-phosphate synthase [Rhodococcus sp. OK270]
MNFNGRATARAAGILLGYAADRALADPVRWHPVAGFGQAAALLERRTYSDHRPAGAVHTAVLVGAVAGVTLVAVRFGRRLGWAGETAITAAATWTALGGTSLVRVGSDMAARVEGGDLAGARALIPSLCGRDPDSLDAEGLTRATVESVAENTSDATVGPLFWAAVAGAPGALGYRAINTLDAMIGYRSERYLSFGWAAARLDDLVNLAPARVTGLLAVLTAPVVGGSPAAAATAWRRDAAAHPSPNAGVAEASMAGALGVRLGGRTEYPHGIEERPTLGDGPPPATADLRRVVRLSSAVQIGAALGSAALAVAIGELRLRRGHRRGLRLR